LRILYGTIAVYNKHIDYKAGKGYNHLQTSSEANLQNRLLKGEGRMKIIATEEHFVTWNYVNYLRSRKEYPKLENFQNEKGETFWRLWFSSQESRPWYNSNNLDKLCDLGEIRLKDMDEAGVQTQILSFNDNIDHLNAEDATMVSRMLNDDLSEAIRKHPDRFAGLATLAPKDPEAAANELERTVKQLGFKGALMVPHVLGEFIDARKYWPIFKRAAELRVPIYVHPTYPSPDRLKQYADYPEMGGPFWGYGAEGGLVAVRLICSGVFDEYPGLTIILGHLGEALPFWMWRMDNRIHHPSHTTSPLRDKLKRLPSQYIRDNFFFTTSGMLSPAPFLCTQLAVGTDRILFASDYPHERSQETIQFLEIAPISARDREKIYHLNSEKLWGLE
jgi:predicted TIM-barrel fold metal-dependent hydrolase